MWEMLDLLEKRETQLCSSTPGDCRLGSGTFKDQERRFRFAVFQAPQDEYLGSSKAEVD